MKKEMVTIDGGESRQAIITALKNSLYLGAKDESVLMVLSYCQAAGLDPMTKPVHIVPMQVKDSTTGVKEWRDVIMPGIELYRTKAARTKEYAGCSEPEFGPGIEVKGKNRWNKEVSTIYPEWCKVTVKRIVQGQIVEFSAKELWIENYASDGKTPMPNAMWSKRPFAQLAKCAEAQALRKAFPEVGAHQTSDEMAGKVIETSAVEVVGQPGKPVTEPPQAKEPPAKKKEADKKEKTPPADTTEPAGQEEQGGDAGSTFSLDDYKHMAQENEPKLKEWWIGICKQAMTDLGVKKYDLLEKYLTGFLGLKMDD